MGVAERREREREQLRSRIVDAARDLLLEQGLGGLSMRAIAERIEYSPATIYIYFKDKDELIREVVRTGFGLLAEMLTAELAEIRESSAGADQYGAAGRAYVRFALENPAYFRVMFELPATANLKLEPDGEDCAGAHAVGAQEQSAGAVLALVRRVARSDAPFSSPRERRVTLMGWGLIHGLTTLYLAGQLRQEAETPEQFMELIDDVMSSFRDVWSPAGSEVEAE